MRVDLGLRQRIDLVSQVLHGLRRRVHAQHRQHAAHGLQLPRHGDQHTALRRVAEIQVNLLFNLRQRGAQFLHHAAHGLAVGDAAVQILHPALQRLWLAAFTHVVDALAKLLQTTRQVGVIEVAVFQRGVQVEHAGGHFHGQRRGRWLMGRGGLAHHRQQGLRQRRTGRKQALQ